MNEAKAERPWRRGVAWLLFLGPFFFLSYGFTNSWSESRGVTAAVVFDWERHIPFLPWTIVPYWSIDLLYGFSFLLCRSRRAVDIHALRLLSAQVICIACFFAFPLRFTFERPPTGGPFGALFEALMGFDKPFNQAPSLHLALLVVLWLRYANASHGAWRLVTHGWASLIALSVLTTYQHHFIDLPTGLLVGLLCLWLWPDDGPSVFRRWRWTRCPIRRRLARRYLAGALAGFAAAGLGGWMLVLLWPASALGIVGLNYLGLGAAGFQKRAGRIGIAGTGLLAPYQAAAWINSRIWTRRDPQPVPIADGVWLGRLPSQREWATGGFAAVLDLTAEFSTPHGPGRGVSLPWLDLVPPDNGALSEAAAQIEALRRTGTVLVCCALGYSRSAAAVAAWLLTTGRAATLDEAIAAIAARRPRLALGRIHRDRLQALVATMPARAPAEAKPQAATAP